MATTKEETSVKSTPVLKKRTSPDDLVSNESTVSGVNPLKKRTLPGDEPVTATKEKKGMPLKKKTVNPLEQEAPSENKEKSSLDQMKERIAAQKKLEQDMMTQQSLRNQEKGVLRNKLSALAKDMAEDSENEVREKPDFSSDLKTEVLETQNKKLKSDLEKIKKQLQSLQSLEYNNVRVISIEDLSLSEEFLETISKNNNSNDKEENNNAILESELANKNEQLQALQNENKQLTEEYNNKFEELKVSLNNQITALTKDLKEKSKEVEKLNVLKETMAVDKQNLQTENKNLSEQVSSLLEKLSESDQENKNKELLNSEIESLKENLKQLEVIQAQLVEKNEKINSLEEQLKESKTLNASAQNDIEEKVKLQNKLQEQTEKLNNLLMDYQTNIEKKDNEINELKEKIAADSSETIKEKLKEVETEKANLENKNNDLFNENNELKNQLSEKESLLKELQDKYDELLNKQKQEEGLPRIKANDSLDQKDYARMNAIQSDINGYKQKIRENNDTIYELTELYSRFLDTEKNMIEKYKEVRKYAEYIKEFELVKEMSKKLLLEVSSMNPKEDKKVYKAKSAEVKSMTYKTTYFEKQLKKLNKKKRVVEYVKVSSKIKEFNEQFKLYEARNTELNELINKKEIELAKLKG